MRKPAVQLDWRPAFLEALSRIGIVGSACKTAKIGRAEALAARNAEPVFAAQWDVALTKSYQLLKQEARRRRIRV